MTKKKARTGRKVGNDASAFPLGTPSFGLVLDEEDTLTHAIASTLTATTGTAADTDDHNEWIRALSEPSDLAADLEERVNGLRRDVERLTQDAKARDAYEQIEQTARELGALATVAIWQGRRHDAVLYLAAVERCASLAADQTLVDTICAPLSPRGQDEAARTNGLAAPQASSEITRTRYMLWQKALSVGIAKVAVEHAHHIYPEGIRLLAIRALREASTDTLVGWLVEAGAVVEGCNNQAKLKLSEHEGDRVERRRLHDQRNHLVEHFARKLLNGLDAQEPDAADAGDEINADAVLAARARVREELRSMLEQVATDGRRRRDSRS